MKESYREDPANHPGAFCHGYDDRYQLTGATHSAQGPETFGYNSVGNRTTSHIPASYAHNAANQLFDDAEFTYSYDLDGDCVGKVSKIDGTPHEYIFNSENRMTGYRKYDISSTLLATADYLYDPLRRRIAKSMDGALTRYMLHVPRRGHLDCDHPQRNGHPLPPRPRNRRAARRLGQVLGRHGRLQGTSLLLRRRPRHNPRGQRQRLARWRHERHLRIRLLRPAHVEHLHAQSRVAAFHIHGREADSENGLYFFRYRYYDQRLGRFAAEDPMGVAADVNAYGYARSNPVSRTDPLGLWADINYPVSSPGFGGMPGTPSGYTPTCFICAKEYKDCLGWAGGPGTTLGDCLICVSTEDPKACAACAASLLVRATCFVLLCSPGHPDECGNCVQ